MKIHPVIIMTAPVIVLVYCAQHLAGSRPARPPGQQVQQSSTGASAANATAGRVLFLRNCAHCHGADAHGDEGPDLHGIGWTDEEIARRIREGKSGQMTAFAGKLKPKEIEALTAYVRGLN